MIIPLETFKIITQINVRIFQTPVSMVWSLLITASFNSSLRQLGILFHSLARILEQALFSSLALLRAIDQVSWKSKTISLIQKASVHVAMFWIDLVSGAFQRDSCYMIVSILAGLALSLQKCQRVEHSVLGSLQQRSTRVQFMLNP